MKTALLAACAAAMSLAAGAAFAGDLVTLKLVTPVAAPTKIVAGGSVWRCDADTCVTAVSERATSGGGCRAIVREVGAAVSYGSERKPLSAEKLASCNAQASSAGVQTAAN